MRPNAFRFEGPWGHCALLLGFITFAVLYTADASTASKGIRDLLLIGPVGAIALLLCGGMLIKEAASLRIRRVVREPRVAAGEPNFQERYGAQAVMATLAAYVVLMPFIGFDTATLLFAAALMVIQGERRIWVVLLVSFAVTFFVMVVMLKVLSVATPTLFMEKLIG